MAHYGSYLDHNTVPVTWRPLSRSMAEMEFILVKLSDRERETEREGATTNLAWLPIACRIAVSP